jgi:pimeloyl-ACP methyl ester carboxylesterase
MLVAARPYTTAWGLLKQPDKHNASNVKLYPAFEEYFRRAKPPLLAIWGKHDPFFIPAGAEAYRRDNPNALVQFLDMGHFATETHVEEIAAAMRQLLAATAT